MRSLVLVVILHGLILSLISYSPYPTGIGEYRRLDGEVGYYQELSFENLTQSSSSEIQTDQVQAKQSGIQKKISKGSSISTNHAFKTPALNYPEGLMEEKGNFSLRVELKTNSAGFIEKVDILESSGLKKLDSYASEQLKKEWRLAPLKTYQLPIRFRSF